MKVIVVIAVLALCGTISCASIINRSDDDDSSIAVVPSPSQVKALLDEISEIIPEVNLLVGPLTRSLLRSIDTQCVFDFYETNNMTGQLPLSPLHENIPPTLMKFVLASMLCSSKLRAIEDFQFELMMSFRLLVRAFIDDPEFELVSDMLTCANKYGVDNKYLDPKAYKFNYEVEPGKLSLCNDWAGMALSALRMSMSQAGSFTGDKCLEYLDDKTVASLIKTIMLLQVDLSEAQKSLERQNAFEDTREAVGAVITCMRDVSDMLE